MSNNSLVMVVRVHFNRPLGPYAAGKALRNVLDRVDLQAQPALESRIFDLPADIYIEKLEILT